MIHESSLLLLLKAPKKKYLKKMLDYAVAVSYNSSGCLEDMDTPIGNSFGSDLEITAVQSHHLVMALIQLIHIALRNHFVAEKLSQLFTQGFDEQLKKVLIELLISMKEEIEGNEAMRVRQGRQLIETNWRLDMQVATEKGKTNTPIVQLQLQTAKDSRMDHINIEINGVQFEAIYRNLQKIKQQIAQLVKQ